ncbi:MAG: hypothetical protein VX871_04195 [Pseudomonadota bacterium]|nr:hypothetical protein [Pseudomonadota bacterium]
MKAVTRLLLILVGYIAGLTVFFLALSCLFALGAWLLPHPGYWTGLGLSPVLFAAAPAAGLFMMLMAAIISAVPMTLAVVLYEALGWRNPLAYALPAALLAMGTYISLSPRMLGTPDAAAIAEAALFGLAGLAGGLAYWLMAGRKAGDWR